MISNSEIETKIQIQLGKWLMIPRFASIPFSYTQIAIGEGLFVLVLCDPKFDTFNMFSDDDVIYNPRFVCK